MTNLNTNTTIFVVKNLKTNTWNIVADCQVSAGSMILQQPFKKVFRINSKTLVAGSGSVAQIQNIVQLANRKLKSRAGHHTDLIFSEDEKDNDSEVDVQELAQEMAEILFNFSMDVHFETIESSFIIMGWDDRKKKVLCFEIGGDGSVMQIKSNYCSIGSGSVYAYPLIQHFSENVECEDEEFQQNLYHILSRVSKFDVFTNDSSLVYSIDKNGKMICVSEKWEERQLKQINERIKQQNKAEKIEPKPKKEKKK